VDTQANSPPLPVAAHNCYRQNSETDQPLVDALKLGIDNIEIDLGWDQFKKRLIVGHEPEPMPEKMYPEFNSYFQTAYKRHLQSPRPDGAPHILTIDWKTDHPDAIEAFKDFLTACSDWFTSAPKANQSPMTQRGLTVCFTGSSRAKLRYDELIPNGGTYQAFADEDYGVEVYFRDVEGYAWRPASAYRRFVSMFWGQVGREPPGRDDTWEQWKADRLNALVYRVHRQGYRVRFYTLNGRHGDPIFQRFPNEAAARLRWRACLQAGADWVATDEWNEIVEEFGR
jgi:hypothetical protein